MAYHEVAMWEILAVLERLWRRESKTAIARTTGLSRATVRRYARIAADLGWSADGDPPSEKLAGDVARQLEPARGREPGAMEELLLKQEDQIRQWLTPGPNEKRGLKLTKVHQLLTRSGILVPYSSLHRFAVKHCAFGRGGRVTVRMAECAPGELAEIDFGRLGLVWDPDTNRRRVAWALVVILPYSRHQYVHVSFEQTVRAVIEGLEDAWAFFGGVVRRLVLDNLAAAITKADRYDPILQRTMEEYARHRDIVIDPAPVRSPTGKPHVERGVPYLRENFFRGETWRDLAHVQKSVITWCRETAGTRIHGTTRQRPLAVFENTERAALVTLVGERFDPPRWAQCSVHPDHHIAFGKAIYSVPTRHVRQKVWVRADSKLVRIYAHKALIKTHPTQPPGGRSTDHNDYPKQLTPYTTRDPARITRQAEIHGTHIGLFTRELLSGTFPWAKLRQVQKLLRLGEKYGWARVDAACQRALAFQLLNVKRLEGILRLDLAQSSSASEPREARVYELPSRFARPATSFAHHLTPTTSASQESIQEFIQEIVND